MFLMRSIFWLTAAFFVIKPGVDIETTSRAIGNGALAAGQQMLAETVTATDCADFTCAAGKAVLAAALQPAPASSGLPSIPLPRPRPDSAS